MSQDGATKGIPPEVAARLCQEVRAANRGRWYTFHGLWCWGCATFTGGDVHKRCWNNGPEHRGCAQVNARYDRLHC